MKILLFLFCLLLFYLLPSMGWLCGVVVFGLMKYSHSFPALHCGLRIVIIKYHNLILQLFMCHDSKQLQWNLWLKDRFGQVKLYLLSPFVNDVFLNWSVSNYKIKFCQSTVLALTLANQGFKTSQAVDLWRYYDFSEPQKRVISTV